MNYESLITDQLADFLRDQTPVVLDMRDRRSFERGHLDTARPADDVTLMKLIRGGDRQRPVLVYCYHGVSSRDLAQFLVNAGFLSVYNLEGGWQAWEHFCLQRPATPSTALRPWATAHGFDADNPDSRISNAMTMLMQAALEGKQALVRELLACGSDPNALNDDGNNALWFACVGGCVDSLRALLDSRIAIDQQNVNGATALIYAASAGKLPVVKLLMEAGADPHKATLDDFNALDSAASLPVLRLLKPYYASKAV